MQKNITIWMQTPIKEVPKLFIIRSSERNVSEKDINFSHVFPRHLQLTTV